MGFKPILIPLLVAMQWFTMHDDKSYKLPNRNMASIYHHVNDITYHKWIDSPTCYISLAFGAKSIEFTNKLFKSFQSITFY